MFYFSQTKHKLRLLFSRLRWPAGQTKVSAVLVNLQPNFTAATTSQLPLSCNRHNVVVVVAVKCTGIWNSTRWNKIPAKGFSSSASKAGQEKPKNRRCRPEYQQQQPNNKIFLFSLYVLDGSKEDSEMGGKLLDATDALYAPFDVIHHRKGFYCRCWPSFSFWGSWSHSHITCFFFSPMWSSVVVVLQKQLFFTPFFLLCCLSAMDVMGYNMPDTKRNIWNIMAVVARQLNFLFFNFDDCLATG